MMTLRLTAAAVLLLAVTACSNEQLGPEAPVCERTPGSIEFTTGLIMQMQAVPGASLVPCVDALKAGWEYEHLQAQQGRSRFWLNSDRLGQRFAEVTLQESCLPSPAAVPTFVRSGVDSFADVEVTPPTVTPVLILTTGRETNFALLVKRVLDGETFKGRVPFVEFDRRDLPVADRVADAHAAGNPAVIVDEEDALNGTASLMMPGESKVKRDLAIFELIDRLDDRVPRARYTGTWYHLFAGGCITYEFKATGNEIENLEADMGTTLGFIDADMARSILRDAGILE